jgi:hypothetical protein
VLLVTLASWICVPITFDLFANLLYSLACYRASNAPATTWIAIVAWRDIQVRGLTLTAVLLYMSRVAIAYTYRPLSPGLSTVAKVYE